MGWDEISNSVCPIARALALVGDRWTMLILIELVRGMHRFDELQAQTGMSSFLLSTRLKRMEHDGLIERRQYSERPPRYEYYSTKKGKGLDPVLMMLRTWGRQWEGDCPSGRPASTLRHKASGIVLDDLWQIPGGGKNFTFDQVEVTPSPEFAAERANRKAAFYAREPRSEKADPGEHSGTKGRTKQSTTVEKKPKAVADKKAPAVVASKKALAAVSVKSAPAAAGKKATRKPVTPRPRR